MDCLAWACSNAANSVVPDKAVDVTSSSNNQDGYLPGDAGLDRSGKSLSGFKGVERNGLKWEARYNVDGVKRNIGTYDNALDAARARRDFVQRVNASRPAAAAEQ